MTASRELGALFPTWSVEVNMRGVSRKLESLRLARDLELEGKVWIVIWNLHPKGDILGYTHWTDSFLRWIQ